MISVTRSERPFAWQDILTQTRRLGEGVLPLPLDGSVPLGQTRCCTLGGEGMDNTQGWTAAVQTRPGLARPELLGGLLLSPLSLARQRGIRVKGGNV